MNMRKLVFIAVVSFICCMSFDLSAQDVVAPRDGFYDHKTHTEKEPVAYPYVRESDLMWSKRIWRTIDLREKSNQIFYYPAQPQEHWKNFVTVIFDALKEDKITVYDSRYDDFRLPLTREEALSVFMTVETETMTKDGREIEITDTSYFDLQKVIKLRLKEDWFFDERRSVLECRIIGICPVFEETEMVDANTNEMETSDRPMFWVYFPEARKVLVNAEVFNPQNDARRLTYDDVFWKRLFVSTIYKESNVYDRWISDYSTGLDALLESDRIHNSIRQYESDMWQY